MNILSLFDGMSCGQIALERAGIKVDSYYASEIDKYAIAITQKNYPNTIQLGDINNWTTWDLPKIDIMLGGFPCFHRDTLIQTLSGLKRIEDIKIGDIVQTHTGSFKKVTKTFINPINNFMYIRALGSLGMLVTKEHPFYVRKRYYRWNNSNRRREIYFTEPEWVNAENLTLDHFACIPINNREEFPTWKGITKVISQHKTIVENNLNSHFNSAAFWKFVGRWFGDGWTRVFKRKHRKNSYQYNTIICCGHSEFLELVELFTNTGFHFCYTKERTVYKFIISNQELTFFLKQFGDRSFNKELGCLVNLPLKYLEALLEGIFESDGHCFKQDAFKITTTSRKLAGDIQVATLKVYGNVATIHKTNVKPEGIIENRVVKQRKTYTVTSRKVKSFKGTSFVDNQYGWVKIRDIQDTSEKDVTYNFEVEGDNSYVAENLAVHNCTSLSASARQKESGLEKGGSTIFWKLVEVFNHYKPTYFLFENVASMKTSDKDRISKVIGVEPIKIDSSLLSAQNRKRLYWTNIPNFVEIVDKNIKLEDILDTSTKPYILKPANKLQYDPNHICCLSYGRNDVGKKARTEYRRQTGLDGGPRDSDYRAWVEVKKGKAITLTTGNSVIIHDKIGIRKLTVLEAERLQTLPDNFTAFGDFNNNIIAIPKSARYKCIGNGWTVDVIAHILKGIMGADVSTDA